MTHELPVLLSYGVNYSSEVDPYQNDTCIIGIELTGWKPLIVKVEIVYYYIDKTNDKDFRGTINLFNISRV